MKKKDILEKNISAHLYWDTQINGNDHSNFTVLPNGWKKYSISFKVTGVFKDVADVAEGNHIGIYEIDDAHKIRKFTLIRLVASGMKVLSLLCTIQRRSVKELLNLVLECAAI